MPKLSLVKISTLALIFAFAAYAMAEDIVAKKMQVKDNVTKPEKRQVQVQSKDAAVELLDAVDPDLVGASLHLYSATDDICVVLPADGNWSTNGKLWKYKNKTTKNQAQIGDGKLKVKIKSGVNFTLADDGSQGTVNAQVIFGTGEMFCMKCTPASVKKDDVKKFQAKDCAATPCDAEPSVCDPTVTTTTSTTTTSTLGAGFHGALPPTSGRFNYGLGIGVPGADARCNDEFAGSHACSYSELQTAEGNGDLVGLMDINSTTVTSFWAIDSARPDIDQCTVTIAWDYQTVHTGQFGDRVSLNNGAGTLGPLTTGNVCSTTSWVGCCI